MGILCAHTDAIGCIVLKYMYIYCYTCSTGIMLYLHV